MRLPYRAQLRPGTQIWELEGRRFALVIYRVRLSTVSRAYRDNDALYRWAERLRRRIEKAMSVGPVLVWPMVDADIVPPAEDFKGLAETVMDVMRHPYAIGVCIPQATGRYKDHPEMRGFWEALARAVEETILLFGGVYNCVEVLEHAEPVQAGRGGG